MSRVKGRDTKLELSVRKRIWRKGFRYRIKNCLPGKPDMVFPCYKTADLIDGCFWHYCPKHYQIPVSNRKYWKAKLLKTQKRDRRVNNQLRRAGWKPIRVWEHEIKKNPKKAADKILKALLQRRP